MVVTVAGVPKFPFTRLRDIAATQISAWGRDAVIRRVGAADIPVRVYPSEFTPQERANTQIQALDRKFLLSPYDVNGNVLNPPVPDKDRIVTWQVDANGNTIQPLTEDESLRIVALPGRIQPDGNALFWRLQLRR